MKLEPKRCSTVLVGSWNLAIFSPSWTARRLFKSDPLDVELGWGEALMLKFQDSEAELWVRAGAVQFQPRADTPSAFARVEGLVLALLETLRETPIQALGINYGYDLQESDRGVDYPALVEAEMPASSRANLKRTVVQRVFDLDGCTATVLCANTPSRSVDINFQFNLKASKDQRASEVAIEFLRKHGMASLRAQSDEFADEFKGSPNPRSEHA